VRLEDTVTATRDDGTKMRCSRDDIVEVEVEVEPDGIAITSSFCRCPWG
jgi:hypothetical protein